MYFSKFIIHQSVLYVILFFKKLVKWCNKEKTEAITKLAAKYAPLESESSRLAEIEHGWKNFCILCLSIKHISGKKAKELIKNI